MSKLFDFAKKHGSSVSDFKDNNPYLSCLFCIYDRKSNRFTAPFMSETFESAKRSITAMLKNPDSLMHQYPYDYSLHFVGYFDSIKGVISFDNNINPFVCELSELSFANDLCNSIPGSKGKGQAELPSFVCEDAPVEVQNVKN